LGQSAETLLLVLLVSALLIIVPLLSALGIVVGIWQVSAPPLQLVVLLFVLIDRPRPEAGLSAIVIAEVLLCACSSFAGFVVEHCTKTLFSTLVYFSARVIRHVALVAHGTKIAAGTHVLLFCNAFEDKSGVSWISWINLNSVSGRHPDVSNTELWVHASLMELNTAELGGVVECHVRDFEVHTGFKQFLQGFEVR